MWTWRANSMRERCESANLQMPNVIDNREGHAMFQGNVQEALNVHDLRRMAQQRLPRWLFEFVDRGTEDEVALRNNRAAFERIKLKTQVLIDVSKRNQDITLFGKQHKMPLG